MVNEKIREQLSPDQILGRLNKSGIQISHERIYQYLLDDKRSGGLLYRNLRYSNREHKKRYGSREKRGHIPNRVSIDKRPKIVDARKRIGDWEADTIIGRNHKGAMVTLLRENQNIPLFVRLTGRRLIEKLEKEGICRDFTAHLKRKNGDRFTSETTCNLIYDKNDKPIRIEGVFRDVTVI